MTQLAVTPGWRDWLARRFNYEERSAALFIAPVMGVLALVAVFPILYSLYTSFFRIKLNRPQRQPYVGFENYTEALQDPAFWHSVGKTASFTVISVSAIVVLSVLVALLLNETFKGRRFVSAMLLIPWAIPTVANGVLWKWIYDAGYGALNGILLQLGVIDSYITWLGNPDWTIALIANAHVWKEVPLATILILVTMKSIPADLYRAAKVDGAHVFQRFVHITIPSLKPGFMLVVIYESMMAIRHFDLFFLLTEGGPADASHVLSWEIYVETFRNLSFGSGSAMSYLLAIVTFAIAYFTIKTLGRKL